MNQKKSELLNRNYWAKDFQASIVLTLVALPLCLGIAQGSKVDGIYGLIAGIVGGVIVGILSGSHVSVSGPAAGLVAVVIAGVTKLKSYETFLLAIFISGFLQIGLKFLKGGKIANFVPSVVVKGMMAAIGLTLIFKQIPHFFGDDADYEGDESFAQPDGRNTITEVIASLDVIEMAPLLIAVLGLLILFFWETKYIPVLVKSWIPGPLVVVLLGIGVQIYLLSQNTKFAIEPKHMVEIPKINSLSELFSNLKFPQFSAVANYEVWLVAIQLALIASVESLLSLEASVKLDPLRRSASPNRELVAQGIGNISSSLIGGLPVTSVVVRTNANILAGNRTKLSAILHGFFLLIGLLFLAPMFNLIPKAALAAILVFTGYKLIKPSLIKSVIQKGKSQWLPFFVTILAIFLTDLLIGVLIGLVVSLFFIIFDNYNNSIFAKSNEHGTIIKLGSAVGYLSKIQLKDILDAVPENHSVVIIATQLRYIDKDVEELINEFISAAPIKNINVEITRNSGFSKNLFQNTWT